MMRQVLAIAACAGLVLCGVASSADYMVGADLSYLAQAESQGMVFKDAGVAKPGLQIFRDHGYGWVRLRLFVHPTRLPNSLEYTLGMAKEAKKLGYKFLLDLHYADSWADPGKQPMPEEWKGKSHEELVKVVRAYTAETLGKFKEAGVMPEMVQVGNEITNGMLWPDGKLDGRAEAWDRFAELLEAGIAGVGDASAEGSRPLVMIHIDRGADRAGTQRFFDKVVAHKIAFDVIGQSYYPWWHGSLLDLRENLAFMAEAYKKDIVVVECAYNWRATEYKTAAPPFPETPEGQRDFLSAVNEVVMNAPGGRGRGVFWWEAAVGAKTGIASRGMFDGEGNALPVVGVFDEWVRGKVPRVPRGL